MRKRVREREGKRVEDGLHVWHLQQLKSCQRVTCHRLRKLNIAAAALKSDDNKGVTKTILA